ncbi:MAG: Cache 3/Cache 2 fusion domain-containing protein, partial [Bacteroidota bacterium]|nr:Cache 3/Cache 2 fusion domain-containing protein [Bacteroidota bacterium]
MKKFNDLNIRTRVSLILGLVFVFILSTMGIYSYQLNKKRRIAATETSMNTNIQDANHLINTQIKVNQEKLNYAIKYATEEFYKGDYKQINPIFGNILINNKYKKSPPNSGKVIINDKAYRVSYNKVDKIKEMTGAEVTIFQKREEGYLRVATTLKDNYGKRLINTYLANSADLMQNMQRGKSFNRITNILDRNYLGIYSPIKINGKVKGIIFVGTLATDFSKLKSILKDKSYFESGYIFMMSKAGKILLHPTLEGKNVSETNLYKKVIQSTKKEGKIQYLWPEKEGKQKVLYYKYNEAIESYIAITYDYEIWLSYLTSIIKSTSITVFLGVSILLLLLILVLKNVIVSLKKGVDFAGQVADGNLNATMDINQNDEIGMLAKSLNRMVEKLKEIVEGVNSGAGNIASASNQMSSNSQQLSQGANEQASSVEEVSSSMEEMVSNIQQNTDN